MARTHACAGAHPSTDTAELIRVRGLVQGVGFRPTIWRLAHSHGLRGWVTNDGEGVRMHVCGPAGAVEEFVRGLPAGSPPLAHIERIEREPAALLPDDAGFHIMPSEFSAVSTGVAPDAATCAACIAEIFEPSARRFRYPFTNCTHCGPRLSIVRAIPYDRDRTSMAGFALCAECSAEYHDPADRRFHAQPIACHRCGPTLTLTRADGRVVEPKSLNALDAADAAATLLERGRVLAIQGLGGYQLACDATHAAAVAGLRTAKQRERKPFALMARNLALIRAYVRVSDAEAGLLAGAAAPIVLLERLRGAWRNRTRAPLADTVAPGLSTVGFMLPNTPLHHLLLQRMERPIVLTSGNRCDEPQAIDPGDARVRLKSLVDYFLEHDRPIERRVDDSVARVVAGRPRILRRARGFAPAALPLPPGFEDAPQILSCGGELKNTFCLVKDGTAMLSPHLGDLGDALTRADRERSLVDLQRFFGFRPQAIACDLHPDYSSAHGAHAAGEAADIPVIATQHHHAHIAACLAENGVARSAPPLIGVALDGLGYGDDGTFWGGEFLWADYARYRRLGSFKPVALPGGEAAVREPWRNTYAHIHSGMGWARFERDFAGLDLYRFLEPQPRALLDGMLARGVNSPRASSCGRLFEGAAAAMGFARARATYEGQGAVEMEAAVDTRCLEIEAERLSYPFSIARLNGLPTIDASSMWSALFADLGHGTPVGVMAARFHRGLVSGILRMVEDLTAGLTRDGAARPKVALSGGVFQNRILFERVLAGLESRGFGVLTHSKVPCNDGGLALGQALIAAARLNRPGRTACV